MRLYGISTQWDDKAYDALLTAALERGGFCCLAQRADSSESCVRWLESQRESLESSVETMRWPGTIVHDESQAAILHTFRVSEDFVRALRRAASSVFDWLGPDLPEDLCFLRHDGRPWFVSIAHEEDAFFTLLSEEADELRIVLAPLDLIDQGDAAEPDEAY